LFIIDKVMVEPLRLFHPTPLSISWLQPLLWQGGTSAAVPPWSCIHSIIITLKRRINKSVHYK